jgi:hypothetical protein
VNDIQKHRNLVLIATYNERENIGRLIERLLALRETVEVLVVDDASPDGTSEVVREAFADDARVHLLVRDGDRGYGKAMVEGFGWCLRNGVDRIVTMDADFAHDPEAVPSLLEAAEEADVVIGSRYVDGVAFHVCERVRSDHSRLEDPGHDQRVPVLSARSPGGDRLQQGPSAWIRVSGSDGVLRGAAGLSDQRGADRLHRAESRAVEDVEGHYAGVGGGAVEAAVGAAGVPGIPVLRDFGTLRRSEIRAKLGSAERKNGCGWDQGST